jgi:hypothetical protein
MDSVQQQILALNTKIDTLHQVIEQINARVLEAISTQNLPHQVSEPSQSSDMMFGSVSDTSAQLSYQSLDSMLDHKDILADGDYFEAEGQSRDRVIDPNIQIQRLTAQLTAAYNRIAALEEQLLSRRVH